jgi:hypothetical protein
VTLVDTIEAAGAHIKALDDPWLDTSHAGERRRIADRYAAGETMATLARGYECGEATLWCALVGKGV